METEAVSVKPWSEKPSDPVTLKDAQLRRTQNAIEDVKQSGDRLKTFRKTIHVVSSKD